MTNKITGGVICIEDGIKAVEEFAPARKARVELSFTVPEDEKNPINVIDYVTSVANSKLNAILGRASVLAAGPVVEQPAEETGSEPPAAKRTRRTAAQIAADEAAKNTEEPAPAAASASATAASVTDAAPASQGTEGSTPQTSSEPSAVSAADDFSEFDVPPATVVTDAELNAACSKANTRLNDPAKIRGLIATFNPEPSRAFQVREIANEQRADFIAKLEALS